MQNLRLNDDDKTKLIYEHQDSFGGCHHEISIKTILRTLDPIIKRDYMKIVYKGRAKFEGIVPEVEVDVSEPIEVK